MGIDGQHGKHYPGCPSVLSKLAQDIDIRQIQIVNLASCRIQIRQPHIMEPFFSQIAVHSYFAPARNHRKHPRLHLYPFFHATPVKQQRLATKQIWMAWTQQAYCIYCNTPKHICVQAHRALPSLFFRNLSTCGSVSDFHPNQNFGYSNPLYVILPMHNLVTLVYIFVVSEVQGCQQSRLKSYSFKAAIEHWQNSIATPDW